MEEWLIRIVDNFLDRVSGPMKFRLILQPLMAIIFAVRSGLRDAKEGRPAYFWAIFTDPHNRREMLRDGWKSVGRIFILAIIIDAVYQIIELHWFYPLEAFIVAIVLAIIPYLLIRGPTNRAARHK
ncbi:MAG TPA: hypothetical protein DDZ40_03545 [Deltaproteobacteria bacterium]|nr:hypothetical protein [Deltaproteobacteria bacterium]